MVDIEVRAETKKLLLDMFPDDPAAMIDYVFKSNVLDVNKCRIAIIKRHYYGLIRDGMTACEAQYHTGQKFFRSEMTIRNLIYNQFYKDIKI